MHNRPRRGNLFTSRRPPGRFGPQTERPTWRKYRQTGIKTIKTIILEDRAEAPEFERDPFAPLLKSSGPRGSGFSARDEAYLARRDSTGCVVPLQHKQRNSTKVGIQHAREVHSANSLDPHFRGDDEPLCSEIPGCEIFLWSACPPHTSFANPVTRKQQRRGRSIVTRRAVCKFTQEPSARAAA